MWNKDISKLTDAELDERSKKDLASAPAQPQPRGSEALREALNKILQTGHCNDTCSHELSPEHECDCWKAKVRTALAAATAARTNLATESPVAETVAIGAGDSYAGSQSHQTAERTPLDVAYDAIWKLWDKDPENQQLALALQAIQRIGQPAPPQPEAPEKEKP
jgi:hypothetical protein